MQAAASEQSAEEAMLREALARDANDWPIRHYKPRIYQREFHKDPRMIIAAISGNQAGKTTESVARNVVGLTGVESVHCPTGGIFRRPPFKSRHWVTDLTKVVKPIILPLYLQLIPPSMLLKDRNRKFPGYNEADSTLSLTNGSFVQFMSYESEYIKGDSATLDSVPMDECPPEGIYDSQKMRIAARGGRMWIAATIKRQIGYPTQWIDKRIRRKGDGDTGWYVFDTAENFRCMAAEATARGENGSAITARFEQVKASLSPEDRAVMIDGLMAFSIGLIYPSFDENVHAAYNFLRPADFGRLARDGAGIVICGLDYGMAHPTACVWLYVNYAPMPELQLAEGDIIQIAEYKHAERSLDQNIGGIIGINRVFGLQPRHYWACKRLFHRDEKAPHSGITTATSFMKAGVKPLTIGNDCPEEGWNTVREALKMRGQPTPWPAYRIIKNACPETVDEFLVYQMKPESERAPGDRETDIDTNNDLQDCLRYAMTAPRIRPRVAPPEAVMRDRITGVSMSLIQSPRLTAYARREEN